MKRTKIVGLLLVLAMVLAGAMLTAATDVISNDAPAAKVAPGATVEIMNFTIEASGDSCVDGLEPDAGVNYTDSAEYYEYSGTNCTEWEQIYYYDNVSSDAWNDSADLLFLDGGGVVGVYDDVNDTLIAGTDGELAGDNDPQYGQGFSEDWSMIALDAVDSDGDYDDAVDAIIIDKNGDGFYQDVFEQIEIGNASTDNPIIFKAISSATIYDSTEAVGFIGSVAEMPFTILNVDQDIIVDTIYTVEMEVSDFTDCPADYYTMKAKATINMASGDFEVVNGNTIKASHVYLDREYYHEGDEITITIEDDALNEDLRRLDSFTVDLFSTSDDLLDPVELIETGANTGIFTAKVVTSGISPVGPDVLYAEDGDTITVKYDDFSDTAEVDSSIPSAVSVIAPSDLQYSSTSNNEFDVEYAYTDKNPYQTTIKFVSGSDVVAFVIDDSELVGGDVTNAVKLNLSAPDSGSFTEGFTYDIKLLVEDCAANVNETDVLQEGVLRIDNTGPSVVSISNNITENGYYDPANAFNITVLLEDLYGIIDEASVKLYYNITTDEELLNFENTTLVGQTATYNGTVTDEDDLADDNSSIVFWVEGTDAAGNAIDGGNSTDPFATYTIDTELPSEPTNLTVECKPGAFVLEWDDATDSASGIAMYNIYRNSTGTDFIPDDYVGSTESLTFTDISDCMVAGTNYNYTVTAVDKVGHEGAEAEAANETFIAGIPDHIMIEVVDSELFADGRDSTLITATIKDEHNRTLCAGNLSFITDAGTLNVIDGKFYESANGVMVVELTSATEVGTATVTVALEGTEITNTTQIKFVNDKFSIEDLRAGWNLISLPLIPVNSSIEEVLADVNGANVEEVWAYDTNADAWSSYIPEAGGALATMEDGKGYWIKLDAAGNMTVYGYEQVKPGKTPKSYEVYEGWNLIGFKGKAPMPAEDYLGDVCTNMQVMYDGDYIRIIKTNDMGPGQGYWLAVSESGTIYP